MDDPGLEDFKAMLDGVFGEECVEENPVKREQAKYPSHTAEAKRAWRARKKARDRSAMCRDCGLRPPVKGRRCESCAYENAAAIRRMKRERQEAGLCMLCGKRPPKRGKKNCGECLAKAAAAIGRKRQAAPPVEEPLTDGERAALAAENAKRGWG